MEIKRDSYLNQLVNAQQNGFIKVVTGPRSIGAKGSKFAFYL